MKGRRSKLALVGIPVVVGIVVAIVALGAPAAAQGDDAAKREEDWASGERDLVFERDGDGFAFTSVRSSESAHDVIEGRYDLDAATYTLTLVDEPSEGPEGIVPATNDSWMRMELAFVELIEFQDVADDGAFSPTNDQIVQRIELEDYRTPSLSTTQADDGTYLATVAFPFTSGGQLELSFRVAPTAYAHDNATLAPTVSAFDVHLEAFPFEDEHSAVALHTRLSTTPAAQGESDPARLEVPPAGDEPFEGRYGWERNLDGSNTTSATMIEWPTEEREGVDSTTNVLFAYPRSDDIHHAGTLGFVEPPSLGENVLGLIGNWYVFGVALVGTTAVVGGSMYLHLKEERAWPPGA